MPAGFLRPYTGETPERSDITLQIGLSIVHRAEDIQQAIDNAYQHDDEVMLEKFIPGREFTVGILGDRALAVGEIIPRLSEIFDYQSKYQPDGADEIFPADISPEPTVRFQELALRAHRALKLRDYSQVDFRLDLQGGIWCLEANTLPGMTAQSLLPKAAAAVGISFQELCTEICRLALARREVIVVRHGTLRWSRPKSPSNGHPRSILRNRSRGL
jgi:D-alanine-D-alanine ligase